MILLLLHELVISSIILLLLDNVLPLLILLLLLLLIKLLLGFLLLVYLVLFIEIWPEVYLLLIVQVEFRCHSMDLLVSKTQLIWRLNLHAHNATITSLIPILKRRCGRRETTIIFEFDCILFLTVANIILIEIIIKIITCILSIRRYMLISFRFRLICWYCNIAFA